VPNPARFVAAVAAFATLAAFAAPAAVPAATQPEGDWPGWIVPGGAGLERLRSASFGLRLDWKVPIGSGYSGIAVANGRAVTMFSAGASDVAAAFDAATGKELWRIPIDPIYEGHDGSDDGPLASPVIADGVVYAIGARGRLFALRLADGSELWSVRLTEALGARAPNYGFVTTPLVEGELLVVLAGGTEERSVVAFDRRTGERRWSYGNDVVDNQSPVALDLAGRRQIMAVTKARLTGLDPKSGREIWSLPHGHDDDSAKAYVTPLGGNRFLVDFWMEAVAYELTGSADRPEVKELFRSTDLRQSFTPPVFHGGHLYGFSGAYLTCVNAETGARVWKSRPPGGRGLLLVEGRLVLLGGDGAIVVAEASPEGYREVARAVALARDSYTKPSARDGRIFVRDLKDMAAVAVTAEPVASAAAARPAMPAAGEFATFLRGLEGAADRPAGVAKFLAAHPSLPLIEGDWVHFLYHGTVEDIALQGDMNDNPASALMERVAGTDLYYRSYQAPQDARWQYRFNVNFDKWERDPRNAAQAPYEWDDIGFSVLRMPGRPQAAHLGKPEARGGRLVDLEFASERLGNKRIVRVYLPAGFDGGGKAYPLLMVLDGQHSIDLGLLPHSLDNLIGRQVRPVVVAFVPEAPSEPWLEFGGSRAALFAEVLAQELVPRLVAQYRIDPDPASHIVMAGGWAGVTAALAAVSFPQALGGAALQSLDLRADAAAALLEALKRPALRPQRYYVDWGRFDERDLRGGLDLREDGRKVFAALTAAGHAVAGGETPDGAGWGAWRERSDRILGTFFAAGKP